MEEFIISFIATWIITRVLSMNVMMNRSSSSSKNSSVRRNIRGSNASKKQGATNVMTNCLFFQKEVHCDHSKRGALVLQKGAKAPLLYVCYRTQW
jgi:hypothetical protein